MDNFKFANIQFLKSILYNIQLSVFENQEEYSYYILLDFQSSPDIILHIIRPTKIRMHTIYYLTVIRKGK